MIHNPLVKRIIIFVFNLKRRHLCPATLLPVIALFVIAQTLKQARYLSEGEWINQLCFIQAVDYNLMLKEMNCKAMKTQTWRNLKFLFTTLKEANLKRLHTE